MKCPCHSQNEYAQCCQPFHTHDKIPSSPFQLMRSRYSGYALGLTSYIIETTHPQSAHYQKDLLKWQQEILLFCKECQFVGLQVISEEPGMPIAYVTFIAQLMRGGKDVSFKERSEFKFESGRWFFN